LLFFIVLFEYNTLQYNTIQYNTATWSLKYPANAGITRRAEHSSVIDGSGNIYVIAGVQGNTTRQKVLSDIWKFNTQTSKLIYLNA